MRAHPLILLLPLLACSPEPPVEEGLLDRDRFRSLLLASQLIEARVNQELTTEIVQGSPAEDYYAELFARHGITRDQFERTFDHYAERPQELKDLYDEVFGILMQRKDSLAQ